MSPARRPPRPPPHALPPDVAAFADFLASAQDSLIKSAEALDGSGATFRRDPWARGTAASGVTACLEGGGLLEKAAASVSVVAGTLSPGRAAAMAARGSPPLPPGTPYAAAALSIVFHPASPHVPTLRGDVRLLYAGGGVLSAYGGGADLTPSYLCAPGAAAFHAHWKGVCDGHAMGLYEVLKPACDAYFYLPARREHRGLGGIFYDDIGAVAAGLENGGAAPAAGLDGASFSRDVTAGWLSSWLPSVEARRATPVTPAQRAWQLGRRGRYVEFNLLYDRGVRFGLDSPNNDADGGPTSPPPRVDAVMVSAPPLVAWGYVPDGPDGEPVAGSAEAEVVEVLRRPRAWV